MTTQPDQLVLDPEILTPLAERVCIRFCKPFTHDMPIPGGVRRIVGPCVLTGPRMTLADSAPETAGGIVVRLAHGERRGFITIVGADGVVGNFAWFVRDPDTEPLINVSELSIVPLASAFSEDPEPFTSTEVN